MLPLKKQLMNIEILNDNAKVVTISSLDLVETINLVRSAEGKKTLRHDHFLAKIEKHPGIDAPKFRAIYTDAVGREKPCYHLPKREAELMVMAESLAVQAKVYDRLAALVESVAAPVIPQSLSAALRLAADQAEQIVYQQAQLAIAAPKAAFVDQYVESTGLKGFRQVAKLSKANEARLREFLTAKKIMYRLGGEWSAYQLHIDAGRFDVKTGANQINQHNFTTTLFTAKGIEWLAGLWAVHCLNGGAA